MVARVHFALFVIVIYGTVRCQDASLVSFTGFSRSELYGTYICPADQIVIEVEGSLSRCALECAKHSKCMGFFQGPTTCEGCQFYEIANAVLSSGLTATLPYWSKLEVYRVVEELMTYDDAEANCESLGGYLAKVASYNEHLYIAKTVLVPAEVTAGAWTGATDRETEGTFLWPDGTPMSLDLWHEGEPTGLPGDTCVASWGNYFGKCNDLPCSLTMASVCKFDI